ncbi:solute carrier family 35 member G1-like isoform X1 [Myxocyprinus asiaticus]|uniref:solute carrier family 35 member G1-like isoform X1 n=1 Tax=Myxocyprinus asiaticus TaxID=70543 RepID=UPI00222161B9|nr:solute carrier family 35 member G1-like isoform X1 [Myxocyprinus asiaticus]
MYSQDINNVKNYYYNLIFFFRNFLNYSKEFSSKNPPRAAMTALQILGILVVSLSREDDIRVLCQKVDDGDFGEEIQLQTRSEVPVDEDADAEDSRRLNGSVFDGVYVPVKSSDVDRDDDDDGEQDTRANTFQREKKPACPGLGLLYSLLASVFFSVAALLVKKIEGIHAIEISAIRCFFQMLFVMPAMIYYKTGFLGPRGMRIFLFLRGFLGSNAMILLYYAILQMSLADATVIMFSNPVFTALLAWIFLKEKCTIWDVIFTIFTLTGVILIARPPFLFGGEVPGIEGDYTNHIKGTAAAFTGAVGAACTMVILRKIGKSVHYYLSVWYYAVLGLIECVIVLFILDEWTIPSCGWDRWTLMAVGLLGIAGQTFLTKALQIEKAGPVALMRTMDVVLAFILQFLFLNRKPTWWSLGGALCVISSTSGVAIRKWYTSTRQNS